MPGPTWDQWNTEKIRLLLSHLNRHQSFLEHSLVFSQLGMMNTFSFLRAVLCIVLTLCFTDVQCLRSMHHSSRPLSSSSSLLFPLRSEGAIRRRGGFAFRQKMRHLKQKSYGFKYLCLGLGFSAFFVLSCSLSLSPNLHSSFSFSLSVLTFS